MRVYATVVMPRDRTKNLERIEYGRSIGGVTPQQWEQALGGAATVWFVRDRKSFLPALRAAWVMFRLTRIFKGCVVEVEAGR